MSSVADLFFPLFLTGLLAVLFVYKGGACPSCTATACVFIFFVRTFANQEARQRSDDDVLVHLKSRIGTTVWVINS